MTADPVPTRSTRVPGFIDKGRLWATGSKDGVSGSLSTPNFDDSPPLPLPPIPPPSLLSVPWTGVLVGLCSLYVALCGAIYRYSIPNAYDSYPSVKVIPPPSPGRLSRFGVSAFLTFSFTTPIVVPPRKLSPHPPQAVLGGG